VTIDEHDIRALERLDAMVEARVDAFMAQRVGEFAALVTDEKPLEKLREELITQVRERAHFQYWGLQ